jgi:hypothetical protein
VNVASFVIPPLVPVTTISYVPATAEVPIVRVKVFEQGGVQLVKELAVTPVGKPETANETAWAVPTDETVRVVAVVVDPDVGLTIFADAGLNDK